MKRQWWVNERGFTLIEVLIVVVIVGILAAVAIPSYSEYVRRGNRADAKAQLLLLRGWMQQQFTANNGSYLVAGAQPAIPAALSQSPATGTAKFAISFSGAVTATTYTVQATPTGSYTDPTCGTLSIDNTGLRMVNSTTTSTMIDKCWNK